jgi:hypothetical protein
MQPWTLSAFWTAPWTRSEIISAWSSGITLCAILVALSIAVWEHRRAVRTERDNRRRFVEEVTKLLRAAVGACEQCLETLAGPQPPPMPDVLARCNDMLVAFGDSMDILRPLAPADGQLTVATTQTRQLLEPFSDSGLHLQGAREALDLRAQRMRAMLNRLLQMR